VKGTGWRNWFVAIAMCAGFAGLLLRAFYLQVYNAEYLQEQGNARHLRTVDVAASRGMILDRNGEPLAVSTPVDSVWANPHEFQEGRSTWPRLGRVLGMSASEISNLYVRHAGREFMYLKRHINPQLAADVTALKVPGVGLRREYKRYYPAGPIAGHVVGYTDVDDHGLEGVELSFDRILRGRPGRKLVLRDGRRDVIEDVESLSPAIDGSDVTISIDSRIQYLALRALKSARETNRAASGSAVVLDVVTGEILAMVNEPDFNPNKRDQLGSERSRNRAVTDVFEPGSTVKPLTIAAALEGGFFGPDTRVDTAPGTMQVGTYTVRDTHDYGQLTVTRVLVKSSNIGATKIAMAMGRENLWQMFRNAGFGQATASGLPGEADGRLAPYKRWRPVEHVTLSFGYGLSVSLLQLARAYAVLANDGELVDVTILRRDVPAHRTRAMSAITARQVRAMLELAVTEGTGTAAQIPQYRVAGKTGTAHKSVAGGYAEDRYTAAFVGMAPASRPRLVVAVVIEDPRAGAYYGGEVAAPVFARVMAGALRLLNIPPDSINPGLQNAAALRGQAPS